MNKTITARQLMFAISTFIIASSLLTSPLYYFTKNDAWFSVIFAFVISYSIIHIYITLSTWYPGLTLIEINLRVFGNLVGRCISFFYCFYFLSLAYFNTIDLGDFIQSMVLPNTPMVLILVAFVIICAYAVRKGPVGMVRYGMIFSAFSLFTIISILFLAIDKAELSNLLPTFTLPARNYLIGSHLVAMLPFCEIITFMMFVQYIHNSKIIRYGFRFGLIIGAISLLIVVLRDIVVLGDSTSLFKLPTFATARLIDVGDILVRLEIVYAIILVTLLFYKVSIIYYAAVSGISKLLYVRSHNTLTNVIGALIVFFSLTSFKSSDEHIQWNLTAAATYSSFFILILPLITLVTSALRGMHLKKTFVSE